MMTHKGNPMLSVAGSAVVIVCKIIRFFVYFNHFETVLDIFIYCVSIISLTVVRWFVITEHYMAWFASWLVHVRTRTENRQSALVACLATSSGGCDLKFKSKYHRTRYEYFKQENTFPLKSLFYSFILPVSLTSYRNWNKINNENCIAWFRVESIASKAIFIEFIANKCLICRCDFGQS